MFYDTCLHARKQNIDTFASSELEIALQYKLNISTTYEVINKIKYLYFVCSGTSHFW